MAPAKAFAQFLDGGWLDRKIVCAAAVLALVVELAAMAFMIAGTHGWIVPLDEPTTTDFVSFYAAGSLADAGSPALAYDHRAHALAEQAATAAGIPYVFFNYPPVFLLLCAVLAHLPYLVAYVAFEGAALIFYLWVGRRIVADAGIATLLALLAVPLVFWNLGVGQNGLLTAALFGAATLLLDGYPLIAGLLFGALCYKPQFALLIPVVLIAGGAWVTVAGATLSVSALTLGSLAVFGAETWHYFFVTAGASAAMYASGHIPFFAFANPFGAVRQLGGGVFLAYAAQAVASLVSAGAVAWVWRRYPALPTRAAILLAAAPVAAPLSLYYDLMLGVIAGAWLVRDRNTVAARGWEMTALAGLWLVLLDGRQIAERWQLPVFPLAGLALLAIAGGRARREIAQRRAAPSTASPRAFG